MLTTTQLQPGDAYPLGAQWDGHGVNFALVAPNAESVELCIFDDEGNQELKRYTLPANHHGVWHGYLAKAAPGLVYAYRVYGPYAPHQGHRFNPNKVLLDPYARLVVGRYLGQSSFCGQSEDDYTKPDQVDTAAIALKARVVDNQYDWTGDVAPRVPQAEMFIYEVHVKGFTQLHPLVPEDIRGTYAGMAHPAALDHLQKLGVTAVSLLPVHHRADEARLQKMELANYWGYSSIGFFAPETRYWSGKANTTAISEFRDMVKALHSRGIEVILDVVYNHTGETDEHGPTLSFRGIDNATYYHLRSGHPAHYENWTGCGNCLNLSEPRVLQMVMDSLRYWVQEMHVDGFRFDLAPELARNQRGFSNVAPFFAALRQDPALAHVKLIAEPWDLAPDGYQLGNFPVGWQEWNDKYRDTMRAFWLHQMPTLGEFARRFAASSDVFDHRGRLPTACINFITAHDGFNLQDLVSYNHKHNAANGEHNRDGHQHNQSWNCGVEGASTNRDVIELRNRLKRALLATLMFSQGVPMMLAGDELGHTQRGNNNAYCQDNALTWLNWEHADPSLIEFVAQLSKLRKRYSTLRYPHWFVGETKDKAQQDIAWLKHDGGALKNDDWHNQERYCIGILLAAHGDAETCLLLINAEGQADEFVLPKGTWRTVLDSSHPDTEPQEISGTTLVSARSLLLAIKVSDDSPQFYF